MSESIIVNGLFSIAGTLCAAWLVWGAVLCLGELLRGAKNPDRAQGARGELLSGRAMNRLAFVRGR